MNYRKLFSALRVPRRLLNRYKSKLPWWVKIVTAEPKCVYFFGPFDSKSEAINSQSGYIEDLQAEQARGIGIEIKQARPKLLTIIEK